MKIKLTPEQELQAAAVGIARQKNAIDKRFPPRHRGGSLWGGNIESACAELATALAMELPWTGAPLWETPPVDRVADVGDKVEVRWTAPSRHDPVLTFDAERDKDDRFYVLAVGYAPEFDIIGFIKGAAARRQEWRHEYPERVVFRVPASALTPIVEKSKDGLRGSFYDPISPADKELLDKIADEVFTGPPKK